jgi:hypothetical protein
MISLKITTNTKGIENLEQMVDDVFPPIVKKHAFLMQASAMRRPLMPVDTGTLKNSMEAKEGENPLVWIVQDGVEYGVFQELGTSRGVPARHFLGHAAEITAEKFFTAVRKAIKEMRAAE